MNDAIAKCIEESRAKFKDAHLLVCALAEGTVKFRMQIPANEKEDTDLILGAALMLAAKQSEALAVAVEALTKDCRCDAYWVCPVHTEALPRIAAILEGKGEKT
jgi:hypothetical protein